MNISPKKLSIDEMWKLHNIIDIQNPKEFEYFVDSFLDLIKKLDVSKTIKVLSILYKKNKKENGLIVANKLLLGLKKNNFFAFEQFIKDLRG